MIVKIIVQNRDLSQITYLYLCHKLLKKSLMKKFYLAVFAALLTFGVTAQTLFEGFESTTFPPTGWTIQSPDGGTGWERIEAGVTPLPGWNGGTVVTAPVNGGTGIAWCTYTTGGATANDQWLITKQFTPASGDFINAWIRKFGAYADKVEIKLSTTGNAVANFTVSLGDIAYTDTDTGFAYKSYSLATYVGQAVYVAFREVVADNFNDGGAIFVDNVHVGAPNSILNNENKVYVNIYPNPATNYVNLSLNENIIRVKVINALGQIVFSNEVNEMSTRINTTNLESGVYFLNIETAQTTVTRKFNVVR